MMHGQSNIKSMRTLNLLTSVIYLPKHRPKRLHPSTKLQGVTSQATLILLFAASGS